MAKQLIPEELDQLIQEYLTDGVLTDKERQVILRKAEGMGLDRDEIDLYLDAQVQKIDQATDAAARRQKGKQCPYCGGSVPQLTDKCPHCGENITPEASKELQEIIDNLEKALVYLKSGYDVAYSKATVERYIRKAKLYYGNNPKIQKMLEEVESESVKAEKTVKSNARKDIFLSEKGIKTITGVICAIILILGFFWLCSSTEAKDQAINDSSKNLSTVVTTCLKDGKLDAAKDSLMDFVVPKGCYSYEVVRHFDATYQKVIRAYIKDGNYDAAEELAIAYHSKIDSESAWAESPTYIYLKSLYIKEGRDFSALRSKEDKENKEEQVNDTVANE